MIIAAVVENDDIKGKHIIFVSKEECKLIEEVFTSYCEANKRKKKAKKMLKEFESDLQVW